MADLGSLGKACGSAARLGVLVAFPFVIGSTRTPPLASTEESPTTRDDSTARSSPGPGVADDLDPRVRELDDAVSEIGREARRFHGGVLSACTRIATDLAGPQRRWLALATGTVSSAARTGACDVAASLLLDALANAERADAPVALVTVPGVCRSKGVDSCDPSRVRVHADEGATPDIPALVRTVQGSLPALVDATGDRGRLLLGAARRAATRLEVFAREAGPLNAPSRSALARAALKLKMASGAVRDAVDASASLTNRTLGNPD
jgi:hypothetical protein